MRGSQIQKVMALGAIGALTVIAIGPGASAQEPVVLDWWGAATDPPVYQAVADEYNRTHVNQVNLTILPILEFVPKVTAAAAGGSLPDILTTDLIYMPDFIAQGMVQPLTDQVNAYEHKDVLSPGHVAVSTADDGQIYGVPFYVDASSLFWNKDLFQQAGLDPDKGPQSWEEVIAAARAVDALGDDIHGFYFPGNGAGPNAYTYLPQMWASGGDVIDYTTHTATMADDPVVREAIEYYKTMWDEGLMAPGAEAEGGDTWIPTFATGKIGVMPLGGGWGIKGVAAANPDLNFGVTALPGKTVGETASFAGGEVATVTTAASDLDAAWEFIEWSLSDEVQTEIFAKNGAFVSRIDLAGNEYEAADPRMVANNEALVTGQTPRTLGYNEIFNDVNGPWLAAIHSAIFGGDVDAALQKGDEEIQAVLDRHYK